MWYSSASKLAHIAISGSDQLWGNFAKTLEIPTEDFSLRASARSRSILDTGEPWPLASARFCSNYPKAGLQKGIHPTKTLNTWDRSRCMFYLTTGTCPDSDIMSEPSADEAPNVVQNCQKVKKIVPGPVPLGSVPKYDIIFGEEDGR